MKKLVHVAFLFVVELIALVYAQAPISVYGALAELHGKAKQEGTTTSKQFFISYALQNLFSADFNTDDGFGTSKKLENEGFGIDPGAGISNSDFWVATTKPPADKITSIVINSCGDIFVSSPQGFFRSNDKGEHWLLRIKGLSNSSVQVLDINQQNHIFAIAGQRVYRSLDMGDNWIEVSSGLPHNFFDLAVAPSRNLFIAAQNAVFLSENNGDSWALIGENLFGGGFSPQSLGVNSNECVFVASSDISVHWEIACIWQSMDSGQNWTGGCTDWVYPGIDFFESSLNGDMYAVKGEDLYRSSDNGNHWRQINTDMIQSPIKALTFDRDGNMFAGTSGGAFHASEIGEPWSDISAGISDADIVALAAHPEGYLFAGTGSGAIFRSILPTTNSGGFNILVVGEDRSDNASALAASGHHVRFEPEVAAVHNLDLNQFDQIWYCDYINLPEPAGQNTLKSYMQAGGRVFFVGDWYDGQGDALMRWRDGLLNEIGAGGVKQKVAQLSYPIETLFNTIPSHPISHKPHEVSAIGHSPGHYCVFEEIGNGAIIVEDQRTGEPVALAFDYGDLTGAPGARAVIYLNSNNSINWQAYVANISQFLGSRQLKTILSVDNATAIPGGKGRVRIEAENSREIAGVQFTLADIPDLLTVDSVCVKDRASSFDVGFSEDASGALNVVLFNSKGATILPGSGAIVEIVYSVESSAVIGDSIALQLSKAILSDAAGQALPFAGVNGVFRFGQLEGDVNSDGIIDVLDLVRIVHIILELPPEPTASEVLVADCNADGQINILDVVCIMNFITGKETGQAMLAKSGGVNIIEIPAVTLTPGKNIEIPVRTSLSDKIAGIQLSIRYDSKNLLLGQPVLAAFASGMSLLCHDQNGELTIVLYSLDGRMLQPGEGTIIKIPAEIKAGGQSLIGPSLAHALLANSDAHAVATEILTAADEAIEATPSVFWLGQNHPNPFNPETEIRFELPEASQVTLAVYNTIGQEVARLVETTLPAGQHRAIWRGMSWNGSLAPSGIYFYRLEALAKSGERVIMINKMSLLR
ncbi:MAG: hypothetical protein H6695_12860 [Deferribacteres bacterium]|nr:hypothetical protein [Deferribacteres bacterium]